MHWDLILYLTSLKKCTESKIIPHVIIDKATIPTNHWMNNDDLALIKKLESDLQKTKDSLEQLKQQLDNLQTCILTLSQKNNEIKIDSMLSLMERRRKIMQIHLNLRPCLQNRWSQPHRQLRNDSRRLNLVAFHLKRIKLRSLPQRTLLNLHPNPPPHTPQPSPISEALRLTMMGESPERWQQIVDIATKLSPKDIHELDKTLTYDFLV